MDSGGEGKGDSNHLQRKKKNMSTMKDAITHEIQVLFTLLHIQKKNDFFPKYIVWQL